MDHYEMSVLEVINKFDEISQREISDRVGISLGMVNLLIRKFVKVGLVKVENLNGKKVKYILTPNGFSVLTKKTIDYISRSYIAVLKIKEHMEVIIKYNFVEGDIVYIYGAQDEVYGVLLEVLKSCALEYELIESHNNIEKFVHWDSEIKLGIFLLKGI